MLAAIIADNDTLTAFKKHLESEWGLESLLFIEDAFAWRRAYADLAASARLARARKIAAVYVATSGTNAINLSDAVARNITSKLNARAKDAPLDCFEEAVHELAVLMERGAVPRFVSSRAFASTPLGAKQRGRTGHTSVRFQDGSWFGALAVRASSGFAATSSTNAAGAS